MSQELTLGSRSRCTDAGLQKMVPMSSSANAALLPLLTAWCLLGAGPAFGQVVDPLDPLTAVPSLGVTSPLGIGATGIPLGATEMMSPGLSPVPTGVTGTIALPTSGAITSNGVTCSTAGISPSGLYGSSDTYDGGGTAAGTAAPATAATTGSTATPTAVTTDPTAIPGTSTSSQMSIPSGNSAASGMLDTSGMSGSCGSGSTSIASSSAPTLTSTSPTTPGGGARTGIPFGSTEIANLGVSSAPAVPTIGLLPIMGTVGPSSLIPTIPTVPPPTTSTAACGTTATIGGAGVGSAGTAGAGNAGVPGTSITARMLRQFILCERNQP